MQEPLEISFNNVEKTPQLETLIHERAERLEAICDELISCHVDLARPQADQDSSTDTVGNYYVRIDLSVPESSPFVVNGDSSQGDAHETVYTVVRSTFEELERQLKEQTENLNSNPK